MRHGTEINVTFQGDINETVNFWRTRERLSSNWAAATKLIAEIEADGTSPEPPRGAVQTGTPGPAVWKGVRPEMIIDFLTAYREHEAARKVKTRLLADYITAENGEERLRSWTVLIASGHSGTEVEIGRAKIRLVERSWHLMSGTESDRKIEKEGLTGENHYRIRRLVSPTDEDVDLSEESRKKALELTIDDWAKDPRGRPEPKRASGPRLRGLRPATDGLLILYPLDPADSRAANDLAGTNKVQADAQDIPVLGFAISFPGVDPALASKVRYVVNNVYYAQELGEPEQDGMDQ